jgi:CPA1 family monovalent cation:H+ antiporter
MIGLISQSLSISLLWNLLLIILVVASITYYFKFPYTIGLVIAGLAAAFIAPNQLPEISPAIYLQLLLPPIIFHAAFHIDVATLIKQGKFIFSYAILGTLFSSLLIGLVCHYLLGLGLVEAFLLGIIISPTDPIAVISTLEGLNAPNRLTKIIEGESLFNDGVAIVVFTSLIGSTSGIIDPFKVSIEIIEAIVLGLTFGVAVGYVASFVVSRFKEETLIQTVVSFFAMYTSYQLASLMGGSGIIGTAMAGIVLGNLHRKRIQESVWLNIDNVWEFLTYLITSFSFILIGTSISVGNLAQEIWIVIIAIVIVLLSRLVTTFGLTRILNYGVNRVNVRWQVIITLAGLRGVVSVMLVSSLNAPYAGLLTNIVFGIVLFSIVVQGLSLKFVTGKLLKNELKVES